MKVGPEGPEASEPSTFDSLACPTAHNRTQHPPTVPVLQGSPCLQVWSKASTVRVSTGKASWAKGPTDYAADLLDPKSPVEDHLILAAVQVDQRQVRESIGHLSKGSRARLMQKLATIDASAPALFVTLTWPTWAAPDREQWHKAWDSWRMRLSRAWPEAAGLWRREYTKAGVVHLHLLTFNVTIDHATIVKLQAWTAKAWADVVDAPDYDLRLAAGTSVEVPRKGRAVSRYIAKYASKTADGDGTERPMGRWWGTFGGSTAIPYTLPDDYQLTDAEAVKIRRTMERWLQAKRRQTAKVTGRRVKGRPPRPRASRRIFTDNPSLWLRLLEVIRQPSQTPSGSLAV